MADKKTEKSAASHKKAVKEFQKEGNPDFQKAADQIFSRELPMSFRRKQEFHKSLVH